MRRAQSRLRARVRCAQPPDTPVRPWSCRPGPPVPDPARRGPRAAPRPAIRSPGHDPRPRFVRSPAGRGPPSSRGGRALWRSAAGSGRRPRSRARAPAGSSPGSRGPCGRRRAGHGPRPEARASPPRPCRHCASEGAVTLYPHRRPRWPRWPAIGHCQPHKSCQLHKICAFVRAALRDADHVPAGVGRGAGVPRHLFANPLGRVSARRLRGSRCPSIGPSRSAFSSRRIAVILCG